MSKVVDEGNVEFENKDIVPDVLPERKSYEALEQENRELEQRVSKLSDEKDELLGKIDVLVKNQPQTVSPRKMSVYSWFKRSTVRFIVGTVMTSAAVYIVASRINGPGEDRDLRAAIRKGTLDYTMHAGGKVVTCETKNDYGRAYCTFLTVADDSSTIIFSDVKSDLTVDYLIPDGKIIKRNKGFEDVFAKADAEYKSWLYVIKDNKKSLRNSKLREVQEEKDKIYRLLDKK
jgi:hypothetical protein